MRHGIFRFVAVLSVLTLVSAVSRGEAADQEQLVGVWSLVLVDNVLPDGSRIQLYGPDPQGILMLEAGGRYSLQIYRSNRAKFASSDKAKGTPEENSALVQGANSHFGRYSIDAAGKAVTFIIEHASFPNWDGTEQKRAFTLSGDRLKYTVPTPTTGGTAIGEVEWHRAR